MYLEKRSHCLCVILDELKVSSVAITSHCENVRNELDESIDILHMAVKHSTNANT
jgi:hypothetical protein